MENGSGWTGPGGLILPYVLEDQMGLFGRSNVDRSC